MQTLAVTEAITVIAEAERKFGLSRSESRDFFTEWYDQLGLRCKIRNRFFGGAASPRHQKTGSLLNCRSLTSDQS